MGIISHSSSWSSEFFCASCDFSCSLHTELAAFLEASRLSAPSCSHGSSQPSWQDSTVKDFKQFLSALPCPLASVLVCLVSPQPCLAEIKVIHSIWGLSKILLSNSKFLCVFSSFSPPPPASTCNSLSHPFLPLPGPGFMPYLHSCIFSFHCLWHPP